MSLFFRYVKHHHPDDLHYLVQLYCQNEKMWFVIFPRCAHDCKTPASALSKYQTMEYIFYAHGKSPICKMLHLSKIASVNLLYSKEEEKKTLRYGKRQTKIKKKKIRRKKQRLPLHDFYAPAKWLDGTLYHNHAWMVVIRLIIIFFFLYIHFIYYY